MSLPSLQAQLDAAAEGAVVRVPAGTFRGNLVIARSVTLLGAGEASVIDGGRSGPAVVVNARGAVVKLVGLVIARGSAQRGGGVQHLAGKLELHECTLKENEANAFGGGAIYTVGESLLLDGCRLESNAARQGGAILADELASVRVTSTLIAKNRARLGGALKAQEGAQVVLDGVTVADNSGDAQLVTQGTMSRRPRLEVVNSIVYPAPALGQVGNFAGDVVLHRVLVAPGDASVPDSPDALRGDPGFRGSGLGPYALSAGSPAIGRADPAGLPAGACDLLGGPRVRDGHADLGAIAHRR